MKKIEGQFRQGDVLIQRVEKIPDGAKPVQVSGDIVLAEGEATGHAHRIHRPHKWVEQHEHEGVLYLRVNTPSEVVHEEHGIVALEPGDYMVRRQTEVWMDEVRQVAD